MSNKNNISQFDQLFKEGLEQHIVQAPAGAFDAISQGINGGANVAAKTIAVKWIVGSIAAVTIATTAYFALKPSTKEIAAPQKIETTENKTTNTLIDTEIPVLEEVETKNNDQDNTEKSISELRDATTNKITKDNFASNTESKTTSMNGTDPKTDVNHSDKTYNDKESALAMNKATILPRNLPIVFAGAICPYSKTKLSIDGYSGSITWFVNDEKVANGNNIHYIFNQKGFYKIECYQNNSKLADTFIEVGLAKATLNFETLEYDMMQANADVRGIKNAVWVYNGTTIGETNKFVYDGRMYSTPPSLVTTDTRGCKDTFYQKNAQKVGTAYFILGRENAISPNNDGINDTYEFELKGAIQFSMVVFDNQNQIVFSTNNPNIRWDGMDQRTQKTAENGVYNIHFSYQLEGEKEIKLKYVRINLIK